MKSLERVKKKFPNVLYAANKHDKYNTVSLWARVEKTKLTETLLLVLRGKVIQTRTK